MPLKRLVERALRSLVKDRPVLRANLLDVNMSLERLKHSLYSKWPSLVSPEPHKLTVAVTASCNLRCIGCRYGRDFMIGSQLSLRMIQTLLDDAKALGIEVVRLYGGEPLLHKQLGEMIRYALALGLKTYVTTNGTLLEHRIDELYAAGLRDLTLGLLRARRSL
jgi:MoaA/NifB/PqqE/SkfB family radical SAM enzyme